MQQKRQKQLRLYTSLHTTPLDKQREQNTEPVTMETDMYHSIRLKHPLAGAGGLAGVSLIYSTCSWPKIKVKTGARADGRSSEVKSSEETDAGADRKRQDDGEETKWKRMERKRISVNSGRPCPFVRCVMDV